MNLRTEELLKNEEFRRWVLNPTPELEKQWQNLLAKATEEERNSVYQLRALLRALPAEESLSDREVQLMWESITERHEELENDRDLVSERRPVFINYWYRVAAVVFLIALGGRWGWQSYIHRDLVFRSDYGQNRQITLPDGSRITLNGNSSLTYPADWEERPQREVWLEGEAYFKVSKQQRQNSPVKFTVHTTELNIEVVGTQFDVKNRRGLIKVVLDEGKVMISENTLRSSVPKLEMKPGEVVEFSEAKKILHHQKLSNPEHYSSWTQKVLVFNKTPLLEVAEILEDTYGIQTSFTSPALAGLTFTGNLPADDANAILETITKAFDLRFNRSDNKVVIEQN